jgi:hypothetical protein
MMPDADGTLLITGPDEREVRQGITSARLPVDGAWMFAGFSDDYRWLVAGEPRVIKRRPKAHPRMHVPRKIDRARLMRAA